MIIDKEQAKKVLMGITPFSLNSSHSFTPKIFSEIDEIYKPIVEVRPFSLDERSKYEKIVSKMTKADAINRSSFEKALDNGELEYNMIDTDDMLNELYSIVFGCIISFKNLIDSGTGEQIKFDIKVFNSLSYVIKNDIIRVVREISGLDSSVKKS